MRPLKNQTTHRSNPISPKKLLHSKWTAALPRDKEKHFMVTKLVLPEVALFPEATIEFVELEAVHSRRIFILPWRDLNDARQWLQGWQ